MAKWSHGSRTIWNRVSCRKPSRLGEMRGHIPENAPWDTHNPFRCWHLWQRRAGRLEHDVQSCDKIKISKQPRFIRRLRLA
jgi:hypothetical protein